MNLRRQDQMTSICWRERRKMDKLFKAEFEAEIADAKPGSVKLSYTQFYLGGGGQSPDRGYLETNTGRFKMTGFDYEDDALWHRVDSPVLLNGSIQGRVDAPFRFLMQQLHTGLHIVNALVFRAFNGALVTGVQMAEDGTARIDFDLPGADNQRLRDIEPEINDVIRHNLPVITYSMDYEEAAGADGVLRSKVVTPPIQADGRIRVIEIEGLDRQACGGTHLTSTGQSRDFSVTKVENKGRRNRRMRLRLV